MRKSSLNFILAGSFVVMLGGGVVHGCRGGSVLSRSRAKISEAILLLQHQGLNDVSVEACKNTIQNLNQKLVIEKEKSGGRLGRIHGQIAENKDIIFIVDKLAEYAKNPSKEDAEYLRAIARTNGTVQGLIIHFMDRQTDRRFKFEVPTKQ